MRAAAEVLERRWLLSGGQLDPSFGQGGVVSGYDHLFLGGVAHAVVVQHDGRIVIAGQDASDSGPFPPGATPAAHPLLVRLNADGTLDRTFGTSGHVTQSLGQADESINALALQPDGKLVAAGYSGTQFFVARFLPDGTLDRGFGRDGFTLTSFGTGDSANAVALEVNGDIVVAGTATIGGDTSGVQSTSIAVARYTPNGNLDPTFGHGGEVTESLVAGGYNAGYGVAVQRDGRIVVSGTDGAIAKIIRLSVAGSLDPTFGAGGVGSPINDANGSQANSVAVAPDGSIISAGNDSNSLFVARLLPSGEPDPRFGKLGLFTTALPDFTEEGEYALEAANATGNAMALQRDGKIVVVGVVAGGSRETPERFAIVRITSGGQLDRSFGDRGEIETNTGNLWPTDQNEADAVALQADGRIVVAGSGNYDFFLSNPTPPPGDLLACRYTRGGRLDPTFGDNGRAGADPHGLGGGADGVAVQPDGRIVVAYGLHTLARFTTGGTLDPTFGFRGRVLPKGDSEDQTRTQTFDPFGQILLQADGKILVGGATNVEGGPERITLARYNGDGSPDRSFGRGGFVATDLTTDRFNPDSSYVDAMAEQADGKTVVAVTTTTNSGFTLLRYNRDGSRDRSFGTRGVAALKPVGGSNDLPSALLIQPDGKILVGGTAYLPSGSVGGGFVLARLDDRGSLDPSFGDAGRVVSNFGAGTMLNAMRLLSGGILVVAGTTQSGFVVAHYISNGRLDAHFGVGGEAASAFKVGENASGQVLIAPDGSIYVGDTNPNPINGVLARYSPTGVLDPAFGAGGLATLPDYPSSLTVDEGGKIDIATSSDDGATLIRVLS